ncbi:transglutaminase domain-containing protein [Sphingobacterium phlebotomi]|uniref:Transglutaminase domain-containing protein n=1 Tax=Sphingobacterium phlebotomi TaxID=2605433 RepID=A0A5D4GSM0_9SPHI|nr:transglutaminase domain-containing protein [Sphingobacterium phlebotomi]
MGSIIIQHVDTIVYSRVPTRFFEEHGDRFAEFELDSISESISIQISAAIDLWCNDFSAPKSVTVHDSLDAFLSAEKYIECDNDLIVQQAVKLKNHKSDLKTIRNIHAFVHKNLKYSGYNPKDVGAVAALQNLNGDCTEFADLFVALCRANKIPARVVEGYKTENISMAQHNWAEVFLPEFGWRIVDPTISSFQQLDNAYIKLSSNRHLNALNGYHFFSYVYRGDPIKVTDRVTTSNVN